MIWWTLSRRVSWPAIEIREAVTESNLGQDAIRMVRVNDGQSLAS